MLCTSLTGAGALAEIGYRLSLEPVWPSRLEHQLHTIAAKTERTLGFADVARLGPLGVDVAKYATFDYGATQAIAAAAHFLEFDGLIVPSARAPCFNLVIFLDRLTAGGRLEVMHTEPVDWTAWRKAIVQKLHERRLIAMRTNGRTQSGHSYFASRSSIRHSG